MIKHINNCLLTTLAPCLKVALSMHTLSMHTLSRQTLSMQIGGAHRVQDGQQARNMTNPLSLTATEQQAVCKAHHDMTCSLLLLVHAGDIILVDSLSSNDAPHGIALSQNTAQLLLLALDLHLPLLQLALQALLVTLQEYHRLCKRKKKSLRREAFQPGMIDGRPWIDRQ